LVAARKVVSSDDHLAGSKPKLRRVQEPESTRELTDLTLQACLVAKDAASNLRDYVGTSSKMAMLAVKDCEKELDRLERRIDDQITSAITEVTESEARQLLACLKFIIDLERIGDLTWSVAKHLQKLQTRLLPKDGRGLTSMAEVLEKMLARIHEGFANRDLDSATWVMRTDAEIDQLCHAIFRRHLSDSDPSRRDYSTNLLLMAQAFERAGDHAKNLGEELFHLVEGRSLRHEGKKARTAAQ
jgi:phosphate transport system protein